jgi:hypothetical protein
MAGFRFEILPYLTYRPSSSIFISSRRAWHQALQDMLKTQQSNDGSLQEIIEIGNPPCIFGFLIMHTSIHRGFFIATFDYQRVNVDQR